MIIILGSEVSSQETWDPNNAEWHYNFKLGSVAYFTKMNSIGTSIVGADSIEVANLEVVAYTPRDTLPIDTIQIFADTERVYQFIAGEFHTLYDYTLEVGDTLIVRVGGKFYSRQEYVYNIVDSVKVMTIDNEELRAYHLTSLRLNNNQDYRFHGWSIERLGSEYSYIPVSELRCDDFCTTGLRCYSDNIVDTVFSVCDTIIDKSVSTFDISKNPDHDVTLYPNPLSSSTSSNLFISTTLKEKYHLTVYDMTGALMMSAQMSGNEISIDLTLNEGIYIVRFDFLETETSVINRLVVY